MDKRDRDLKAVEMLQVIVAPVRVDDIVLAHAFCNLPVHRHVGAAEHFRHHVVCGLIQVIVFKVGAVHEGGAVADDIVALALCSNPGIDVHESVPEAIAKMGNMVDGCFQLVESEGVEDGGH
jgi:hypothetical protein